MRSWIVMVGFGLVACRGSGKEPAGTFMLEVAGSDTRESIDARVANTIEVVESRTLAKLVAEERGSKAEVPGGAIHARRRGDSTVIEVSVSLSDPLEATKLCNDVIMTFANYERSLQMTEIQERMAALASLLDKHGADDPQHAQLTAELAKLDVERTALPARVRLLDPCAAPR